MIKDKKKKEEEPQTPYIPIRRTKTYRLDERAIEKVRQVAFDKRITQSELLEIMIFDFTD